jgi:hypothetical protein
MAKVLEYKFYKHVPRKFRNVVQTLTYFLILYISSVQKHAFRGQLQTID